MVRIHEAYRDYDPPRWIRQTVERLLTAITVPSTSELGSVVLTNSATVGAGRTRRVLFHELGHHLDRTIGAPVRSGEAAADAWRTRLSREYFRARYWWFRPIARVLRPVMRWRR